MGLFCRISSLLQGSFARETYNFIDPTNQSHAIRVFLLQAFLLPIETPIQTYALNVYDALSIAGA